MCAHRPGRWASIAALLVALIAIGFSRSASAAGGTATWSGSSTNWNTSNRWRWTGNPQCTYNGFSGTQCVPGVTANATGAAVVINSSVTVTVAGSIGGGSSTIASITISNGTVTVSGSNTVTTTGGLTLNGGDFNAGTGAINVGGTLTISSSGSTYTPSSGALSANAMSLSAGSWAGGSTTGTISVAGAIALSGSFTFTASSSSAATITAGSMSQSNTSNGFLGSAGSITLTGDLTLSGSTFRASSGTTQIGGRFNRTGGTFAANGGTVVLASTGSVSHAFGGQTLNDVIVGSDSGLVGYWKLDETSGTSLADSSAFGNTGTLAGGTGTTSPASGFSFSNTSAITLNGSTGYASLGTAGIPANNDLQTLSLWFRLSSTTGQQNMIVLTDGSTSAVQIGIKDGALKVWSWGGSDLVSTTAPSTGAWHHVAYTWDGTTNRLYVDGGTPATSTTAHQTATVSKVYLGTYTPNNEMYNGALDEVRVYNRAISAGEVATLAGKSELSFPAGGTHTFSDAFVASGTFTIGTGTVTGSSSLSIGGSFLNTGGTFSGTGTVTLTGTTSGLTLVPRGATFGALTINAPGGTYSFGGAVTVTNNFTISAGTVTGANPISVGGNWTNSGGVFQGTGAVTLTGTGSKSIQSNGGRFNGLTLSGGIFTLQDRFSASGATLTLNSSTLIAGSHTARVGQLSLVGSGAFTAGTGTVIVDGAASHTLGPSSFSNLKIESTYETGLVGYWKLDEGAGTHIYDHSGNGNSGTLSSSGVTWQSAVPSTPVFDNYRAVAFDGSTGYASLGVNNFPATGAAHSISFWANLATTAGTQNMVALTGSGNAVQVGIRSVSGSQALVVWGNGGGAYISRSVPSTGTWHHIAYVYDGGGNQRLYVNGSVTTATATNQAGATTAAWLGTYSPGNEMYNGSLDDVRVYSVALTEAQVGALAAGRYAGTGGAATVGLGAATTVSGQLEVHSGTLSGNGRTLSASLGSSVALIRGGTYAVGSAAQSFSGGLTVEAHGTLTLADSGGSVRIGSGKALTVNGTLNATSTGATIRSISGRYDFWVGSTNGATPTLNITGLAVRDTTANGMRINGNGTGTTTATTTFTRFDNIAFSDGPPSTGTSLLQIYAPSLNLVSNGCTFDASTTYTVKLAGDGFTTEATQTRAVFGSTTCSAGSCQGTESDDDPNDDGGPTAASGGAVVLFVSNAPTDTAGTIVGFPTAAFSWNDGSWYATYVAFSDASGTADTVYVRDTTGAPRYSWSTAAGETIVSTPRWTTEGTGVNEKHYVYVALASGKVYRLLDNGSSLAPDTASPGWSTTNPFDCGCTITTPIAMTTTNLYWAGQRTSDSTYRVWAVGQADQSVPGWSPMRPSAVSSPTTGETAVTAASLAFWTSGSTYLFLGQTGYLVKANVSTGTVAEYNSNPGAGRSILGRITVVGTGTNRVLAGDDGGSFWSIAPGTFTGTNRQWGYTTLAGTDQFRSAPIYDHARGYVHFGSEGGRLIVLDASTGSPLSGYPMTSLTTDPMRTAILYRSGIIAVGTTTGKLFFVNRRTTSGGTPVLMKEYYFGATQQVSGIAFDSASNSYLVSTSGSSADGRLFMIKADSTLTDTDGNL